MWRIFLCITALLLSLMLVLASCGDDGHTHKFGKYVSNGDATCENDGTKSAKCESCDEIDTVTDAGTKLEHSFGEYASNGDATCTEDGTKTAKCENCDEIDTVTDAGTKLEHSFDEYASNGDATCTKDGTKTAKCDRCSATDTQVDIDSAGHSFTNYASNGDATCAEDGTKSAKCENCDEIDTVTDAGTKLEHSFGEYVSNNDGAKTAKCSNCDETNTAIDELYATEGLVFTEQSDGTYAVTGYTGSATEVFIPKIYNGKAVTSIGNSAFYYCMSLASITIPDSVTSIGEGAFCFCISIVSITIPDSVTSIGNNAFGACLNLASITIPDSVTTIGNLTFYCCISLTIITIPESVTSIGDDRTFDGCFKLVEIINKSDLEISVGSEDYGYIGYYAKEVHTGESKIVNLNDYLFYTYGGVNYLLGYVGDETELVLPESYNGEGYEIYNYAFWGCASLTSITIPNGVTNIGEGAFSDCTKLVEVINKSSLNITKGSSDYGYIGYYAKEVHKGESKIVNKDGYLFYTYEGTNYLLGYVGDDTKLILPESYNGENYEIYWYAFYNCSSLTSVVIGDSVTAIGEYAFYICSNLTSVVIPNNVTSIGSYTFYMCSDLTIYCEAESKPNGWSDSWNPNNCPVVWGVVSQ